MKVTCKRNFGNYERFGDDAESTVSNGSFQVDAQNVLVKRLIYFDIAQFLSCAFDLF